MKKFLTLSLLVMLCQIIYAQSILKGKVTDQNNEPLQGAAVFAFEQNKGTVTNREGEFELIDLPSGKIKIQFSYVGYENKIETIILNNSTIELNIRLIQTSIESEEIIITGGYNSTQHENAVKINVLKLDNIAHSVNPNFSEKLSKVPGVDMISKGNGISKPVIRGLAMDNILVLNNNVRYENYQYSDHHPLGIDEFGIDKLEIIKGPASLLYGSDAIGGVINFINEKPAPIGKIIADYNAQLFSNSQGIVNNVGVKGSSKSFFAGLRFGQKSHSDYLQGRGIFVPNTRFNNYTLKANAGYTRNFGIFKLFYDYNSSKIGIPEDHAIEHITERNRNNEIFFQQFNTHLVSSQNKLFIGNYKIELNTALQKTDLIHFGDIDETEIEMALQTITYETKIYFPTNKKSEYILGMHGFYQLNTNKNNRETILMPNATTNNYSVFGLLQHTFFNKLILQSGIRYDYKTISSQTTGIENNNDYRKAIENNYGSFSGSFGATYNLSEKLLFRYNFASAYRTPNLAELTSNGMHEARYELGNCDLIPQKAYENDFSIHFHTDNLTCDIAGFYNVINNYIYIAPSNDMTSEGNIIYKYIQNNAGLFGGEAGFHFHPKNFDWLHFETTFSNVTGIQENGEYLPFIPANKLRNELKFEKDKITILENIYFIINSITAFKQNKPSPDEEKTGAYTLFNIGFGYKLKVFSFGFYINNLSDKKYIDHLSTLREVNYYNPGRNFALSLSINLITD
jgi:iron complex outermembrane receptor protein